MTDSSPLCTCLAGVLPWMGARAARRFIRFPNINIYSPHAMADNPLKRNATLGIRYTFHIPFTIKNNISKKCRSLGFT